MIALLGFPSIASALQATVVLSKIEVHYPAIAVSARITGTVRVRVGVTPDGHVAETTVLNSASPFLTDAAVNSASLASFECRGCTEPSTPHVVVFVFSLDRFDKDGYPPPPEWNQTGDASSEVTIFGQVIFLGPPGKPQYVRDRSVWCLWLWHCKIVAVIPVM